MAVPVQQFLGVDGQPVRIIEEGGGAPSPVIEKLAALAAWLSVDQAGGPGTRRIRLVGSRRHGHIELWGDIEKRLLEPLVETLRAMATGQLDIETPATAKLLGELRRELTVDVVVSPVCPHCPRVAATVLRFALMSERVGVRVVRSDVPEAPAGVTAVPTVLVDGHVVAQGGALGEYALAERIHAAATG